jgi:hypothetical protein
MSQYDLGAEIIKQRMQCIKAGGDIDFVAQTFQIDAYRFSMGLIAVYEYNFIGHDES